MITAVHTIIYTKDAKAVRAFFKDVLKFKNVDAGDGWLLFALPPAELGVHPAKGRTSHEISLQCDDIRATLAQLEKRGVKAVGGVTDAGWGVLAHIKLPDGSKMMLYESKHKSPLAKRAKRRAVRR